MKFLILSLIFLVPLTAFSAPYIEPDQLLKRSKSNFRHKDTKPSLKSSLYPHGNAASISRASTERVKDTIRSNSPEMIDKRRQAAQAKYDSLNKKELDVLRAKEKQNKDKEIALHEKRCNDAKLNPSYKGKLPFYCK